MLSTLRFIAEHPLNRATVLPGLARFAWWQIASRLRGEVEVPWVTPAKLALRRGMVGATGNLYCGLHEYMDMSFALHLLRPGDLFLDVGANVGSFTVLASKVCGARSIAFEPGEAIDGLLRNIAVNQIEPLVQVRRDAVGDRIGQAFFTEGQDAMNHVAEAGRPVSMVTLNSLETQPTLIKLDVEGGEEAVIRGAGDTLPHALAILTESVTPTILSALQDRGFQRRSYHPATRSLSKEIAPGNALFVRDEEAVQKRVAEAPGRRVFNLLV